MNILFVAEYFPPKIMGGGEINLFLLAKNLSKKGIKVYVLTSFFKGLKKYEKISGINVYRILKTGKNVNNFIDNFIRSFIFPKSIIKEVKKLKKELKLDIIHFIGTSIVAAKELKNLKIPLFATIESYPTLCPKGDRIYKGEEECKFICSLSKFLKCQLQSPEIGKMQNRFYFRYNPFFLTCIYYYYKKLERSLKYCNLIAISKYIQKLLTKYGLKSTVIPNIIDSGRFHSIKGRRKEGKIRIIYLGSLTEYKGPQILLKAIKGIDCRCDLYGRGVMKDELIRMIKDHNLDAEIHDNVPYEKVPPIYAGVDIVVFPSIWPEPFGRIAIEAMAAGKPVIGSRIGGIPETIKENGVLVEAGNVDELRKAILKLIKNGNIISKLTKLDQEEVKKRYSGEVVIKNLLNCYKGYL